MNFLKLQILRLVYVLSIGFGSVASGQNTEKKLPANDSISAEKNKNIFFGIYDPDKLAGNTNYVQSKDFNKGFIVSPLELFVDKFSGLRITNMVAYSAYSLSSINKGLANFGGSYYGYGARSLLIVVDEMVVDYNSFKVNPNDIESATFLDGALAVALYGEEAASGALVIKRKKSTGKLQISFAEQFAISTLRKKADLLSADEFRQLVKDRYANNPTALGLLGNSNVDYQDLMYQNALSQSHFLSVEGGGKYIPFRISMGNINSKLINKGNSVKNNTASIALNPSFFGDQLKIGVNMSGSFMENNWQNNYFIQNPTQANIYWDNSVSKSKSSTLYGNIAIDYIPKQIPNLNLIVNYNLEKIDGQSTYLQKIKRLNALVNYKKDFKSSDCKSTFTLGYSNLKRLSLNATKFSSAYKIFANANFDIKNKYLFTIGCFDTYDDNPYLSYHNKSYSVNGQWNIVNQPTGALNYLKFQTGFSSTGNFKDGSRNSFNSTSYWKINSFNSALSFGFFNNKFTGILNLYNKLNNVKPGGGYYVSSAEIYKTEDKGVELSLKAQLISQSDLKWSVNYFITYDRNEIIKLGGDDNQTIGSLIGVDYNNVPFDEEYKYQIQINKVGYPAYSFYTYQQKYDNNNKPIEGSYVSGDKNLNKKPTPDFTMAIGSQLEYKNFEFSFTGRVWLGNYVFNEFNSSASIGGIDRSSGLNSLFNTSRNVLETNFQNPQYYSDLFLEDASFFRMSDIRLAYNMNGKSLGLGKLKRDNINLQFSLSVQNAFVITKFSGTDPESILGIYNATIPRPRIFSLGIKLDL